MKTVYKTLDILELFLTSGSSEMRLTDIASLAGLNKTTVNRILSVLVEKGYVTQRVPRGKYTLGTKFLHYSTFIKKRWSLLSVAKPHLNELNNILKESVVLFSFDNEKPIFLEEINSKYSLRFTIDPERISVPNQLHCASMGKVFLSEKTDKEIEEYIKKTDFRSFAPGTITDPEKVKADLQAVSLRGVAFDFEEFIEGIMSIAAGIRNEEGKLVGCVSIIGPTIRITKESLLEMMPYIKQCAMKVSVDLGYQKETIDNFTQ